MTVVGSWQTLGPFLSCASFFWSVGWRSKPLTYVLGGLWSSDKGRHEKLGRHKLQNYVLWLLPTAPRSERAGWSPESPFGGLGHNDSARLGDLLRPLACRVAEACDPWVLTACCRVLGLFVKLGSCLMWSKDKECTVQGKRSFSFSLDYDVIL